MCRWVCSPSRESSHRITRTQTVQAVAIGSRGIMVMRARCSVHRQTYRSALSPSSHCYGWIVCTHVGYNALLTGISELKEFYSRLDFTLISEARFFPFVTSFTEADTGLRSIRGSEAQWQRGGFHRQHARRPKDCCRVYRSIQ